MREVLVGPEELIVREGANEWRAPMAVAVQAGRNGMLVLEVGESLETLRDKHARLVGEGLVAGGMVLHARDAAWALDRDALERGEFCSDDVAVFTFGPDDPFPPELVGAAVHYATHRPWTLKWPQAIARYFAPTPKPSVHLSDAWNHRPQQVEGMAHAILAACQTPLISVGEVSLADRLSGIAWRNRWEKSAHRWAPLVVIVGAGYLGWWGELLGRGPHWWSSLIGVTCVAAFLGGIEWADRVVKRRTAARNLAPFPLLQSAREPDSDGKS